MNDDDKWRCYVCQPEPLQDLVAACEKVLRNLECMKKPKGEHDKAKRDSMKHKQGKVKNAALNGRDANSDGSGTLTFSYKTLEVPKELVKKTKKLIETTNGLNSTFVQFIQQEPVYLGENIVRHRHLKAFKSVLSDLKKAHATLEEALDKEFKDLEVQNGEGNGLADNATVAATVPISEPAEKSKDDPVVPDGLTEESPAELEDDVEEEDVDATDVEMTEEAVPAGENPEEDFEENKDNAKAKSKPECTDEASAAGDASLDKDIVSIPPSVPEELFEMVESLSDCVKQESEKDSVDTDSTSSKTSVSDKRSRESSRRSAKTSKKLVVKLTPIPLKITIKKDESKSQSKEKDGALSPDESRRSPRMKTTPLRKSSEGRSKSCSEGAEANDEDCNTSPTPATADPSDSDSDEVPEVLRQVEGTEASSDEPDAEPNGKAVSSNEAKKSPDQPPAKTAKRKLIVSSDSDDVKSSRAKKQATKKKKGRESDSSNHDSDLEKEIKSLSKLSTTKKSKRGKKQTSEGKKEDDDDGKEEEGKKKKKDEGKIEDEIKKEGKKGPKRSFERKRRSQRGKENAARDSSSNDEEEEQAADSGEDSGDQQKIKPILESAMPHMDAFHQSSGGDKIKINKSKHIS